jgi:outer membrane protein OmpA-like peptidoglycan-associated protein
VNAKLLAAVSCLCILLPLAAANAQTAPADGPLPPPGMAPESRLTVTPAEFEQWLAGLPPPDDTAVAQDPDAMTPSLATPPPPPPVLVTPPPPPVLVAPPPLTTIAPAPTVTPAAPAATPPDATPQPPLPTVTAPLAPVLEVPAEPRVATLPPDSPDTTPPAPALATLARPDAVKILYPEGVMELPEAAKPELDKLAAWLRQNPSVRVQIVGYASETANAESPARRTSLYRTLAVRKYLVENGILSTRMNVRALGAKTDELPRDRVEVSLPPS